MTASKKPTAHTTDHEDVFASVDEEVTEQDVATPVVEEVDSFSFCERLQERFPLLKRHPLVISAGLVVLPGILIGWLVSCWIWPNSSTTNQTTTPSSAQADVVADPTSRPRLIDGVLVKKNEINPTLRCVMIENADFEDVRPQSGLSAASVVYEVIVEGGITRFMAVFPGDENQKMIGPVRSARDTYIEFASEYNCPYAHAGGSFTAMNALYDLELRNLDGLFEPDFFWRDDSKYAPHNLFTSTDRLTDGIKAHSWPLFEAMQTFDPWTFVDEQMDGKLDPAVAQLYASTDTLPTGQAATTVSIGYDPGYEVAYTYNADTHHYERANGGAPHIDAATGKVIEVANIVIEHVPDGMYLDEKHVNWSVTGEGKVEVIHNGKVYSGVWKKADRLGRTQFYTDDGDIIPLQVGNTWVEIVPPTVAVSIQ